MINTKTYEEIKNGLVNRVLRDYAYYKRELENFKSEIEQGQNFYAFKSKTPISQQSSAKRSASYDLKDTTTDEKFLIELGNLSERFNYINRYKIAYSNLLDKRENLTKNINDLVSFNKITKEKFSANNDATAIFDPIMEFAVNNSLWVYFDSIEMTKHSIDNYLENNYELDLKGIVFEEDGINKIDNNKLQKKESLFFEKVLKAIEYDLEQIQSIENKIESENYLKYWLLFK